MRNWLEGKLQMFKTETITSAFLEGRKVMFKMSTGLESLLGGAHVLMLKKYVKKIDLAAF